MLRQNLPDRVGFRMQRPPSESDRSDNEFRSDQNRVEPYLSRSFKEKSLSSLAVILNAYHANFVLITQHKRKDDSLFDHAYLLFFPPEEGEGVTLGFSSLG